MEPNQTLKRKTIVKIKDINQYWDQKNSLDIALLNIIDEKDRVAYPEERVGTVNIITFNCDIVSLKGRYLFCGS